MKSVRCCWRRLRFGRSTRRYLERAASQLHVDATDLSNGPDGYACVIVRRAPYNQVAQALSWLAWERGDGGPSPAHELSRETHFGLEQLLEATIEDDRRSWFARTFAPPES